MTSGASWGLRALIKQSVARRGIIVFCKRARERERERQRAQKPHEMVRGSIKALKDAVSGLNKTLSEILVCPLSKKPLRFCEETNSLISDAIGVSYPIKDGIPCLVPTDGKPLETYDTIKPEDAGKSSAKSEVDRGGSH